MGIDIYVYTIYGVRLEWNDEFYEAYEANEEALAEEFGYNGTVPEDRQIDCLWDAMGGEYVIPGIRLYDSGNLRYCDDLNEFAEIDLNTVGKKIHRYKHLFKTLYPEYYHLIEDKEFKLINLMHFT